MTLRGFPMALRRAWPFTARPDRRHLLAGSALAGGVLLVAWSAATTSYILFHDDALRVIASHTSDRAAGYEREIERLETELMQERAQKLVEQKRLETTVEQLRQRQTTLEARHGLISDMLESAGAAPPAPAREGTPKAAPISDTIILAPTDMREALGPTPNPARLAATPPRDADSEIADLGARIATLERAQDEALDAVEARMDARARRMRSVFAALGLPAPLRPAARVAQAATGGPFVPLAPATGDMFERRSERARASAADLKWLGKRLDSVPLRRPVPGSVETTSGFGARLDPFLGQAAFHTGIDFRGTTGDPARATAAGRVVSAERDGGYGLMVEIDHGNGLATRYAHLSAISVKVGDMVATGGIVGRVGSTGRSTGPHLHYETRINGEPVDPQRFIRAGLRLQGAG
ncbi:peptidoglycan DD-metalloendopeptidase family protein [Ancylobacter terrae]|uniref:peptidoglycan DD-metalloendopeptidase family protein n=1 Tax=Ancylobacter sp. sgz301288 TaxID=3342077 RepID=UPI003859BAD6